LVGGVVDDALRIVDSIREVRQRVAGRTHPPHSGVQSFERAGVLPRHDVVWWDGFVVRPQRDRELVVDVDARFDPRIEGCHRGAGLSQATSHPNLGLGLLPPDPGRNTGENVAWPKVYDEPIRIMYDERVDDTQTAVSSYRGGCRYRSGKRGCVHAGTLGRRTPPDFVETYSSAAAARHAAIDLEVA
jgi:hypothetical protein